MRRAARGEVIARCARGVGIDLTEIVQDKLAATRRGLAIVDHAFQFLHAPVALLQIFNLVDEVLMFPSINEGKNRMQSLGRPSRPARPVS